MTKPLIKIHNTETGEIIEREMNDEEYAQFQSEVAAYKAAQIVNADQLQQLASI